MLVNYVLLSLRIYWARIFVIPKGVIKGIVSVYRNYLCDGKIISNRSPPVALTQVCKTKKEGGLGIRDCDKWNKAAIGKIMWDVASKTDSLWVKWINHTYLKDQDWKIHQPPVEAS